GRMNSKIVGAHRSHS
ncbi:unnamed protein product, partial [Oikopleura dioica]